MQSVERGSPAARAGLRGGDEEQAVGTDSIRLGGDIIKAVDGRKVRDSDDVSQLIGKRRPGDRVSLEILRDATHKTVSVTLGRRPGF